MTAPQPSYPATPDTSHPAFAGSTNQLLIIGDAGGWAVNNGVGISNPTVNGTSGSLNNALGDALVFNGTNTYVSTPITNVPYTKITIIFGGIFDSFANYLGLIDCMSNGVNGWGIFQVAGGVLWFSVNGYGGNLSSSSWPTNTIVHGALRNDAAGTCSWFRNGSKIASTATAVTPFAPTNPLWIGNQRGGGIPYLDGSLNYVYLFDTLLSDSVIAGIHADPYSIFLSSGGNNYVITPSGSINFSGSIPTYRQKILEPSGGLKMLGSGILNKQKIFLPSGNISFNGSNNVVKQKVIVPSGGTAFSGTSNVIKTKVITPSGEITFNGTASLSGATSYIITPTGGINLSGSAIMIKSHIVIPTGSIVFGGSAPISSNTIIATVSTRLPLTGVGL